MNKLKKIEATILADELLEKKIELSNDTRTIFSYSEVRICTTLYYIISYH